MDVAADPSGEAQGEGRAQGAVGGGGGGGAGATPPTPAFGEGSRLMLVDGSSFVFRAFFQSLRQDPKYNFRRDGFPTGGLRIFCNKMLQFARDGAADMVPTHVGVVFDAQGGRSVRKELSAAYKADRPAPPDDLRLQMPMMRQAVRALGLEPLEVDLYEADDLIASYARAAAEAGAEVLVVSSDKDLMQLVGGRVAMFDPPSGEKGGAGARAERRIGVDEVVAHFGVPPERVVDVQALAGDPVDGVPGARGIGLKTAAELINRFGDLDTLLERAGEITQPKRREALTDPLGVEAIRLSRVLVDLKRDLPLPVPLADLRVGAGGAGAPIAFFKAFGFAALAKRVGDLHGIDPDAVAPDVRFVGRGAWGDVAPAEAAAVAQRRQAERDEAEAREAERLAKGPSAACLERVARWSPGAAGPLGCGFVEAVRPSQVEAFARDAAQGGGVLSLALLPERLGVALAGVSPIGVPQTMVARLGGEVTAAALSRALAGARLVVHGAKGVARGVDALLGGDDAGCVGDFVREGRFDDVELVSYVLDSGRRAHGLAALAKGWFQAELPDPSLLLGKTRKKPAFAEIPPTPLAAAFAAQADAVLRLHLVLFPRLAEEGVAAVYEGLERPMVGILRAMEDRGVALDAAVLAGVGARLGREAATLEAAIHERAGGAFNIASPVQLGEVLFGKLKLPGGRRTGSGAWSTAADVLEEIALSEPFARQVLDWRGLTKLKGGYCDALPGHLDARGRAHTSFDLAVTSTGRLASSDPNLQNIPVRDARGRAIRAAFVAAPGHVLVCADYSQIELRLLAHMADVATLKAAFAEGLDIHAATASQMFCVPLDEMTPEVRRRAKAINFGIIYGISGFGLSNQLGIPRQEASACIKAYFERFPGIRDLIEATKASAREAGHVETLFGRRCHFPRIGSSNAAERASNERAAVNAPIQGTAADVVRRAMVAMPADLSERMLLQVHDELVFEVPEGEASAFAARAVAVMEAAADLSVPLKVDAKWGRDWDAAH